MTAFAEVKNLVGQVLPGVADSQAKAGRYTLYAYDLSAFSGKARAYLRYKDIPHIEKTMSAYTLLVRSKKRVGERVMPILVTPDGNWRMDTTLIMDELEPLFPQAPIMPSTPKQRVVAALLEAWGDEGWYPSLMHYRWSFTENRERFRTELGDGLFPHAPRRLKNRLADTAAAKMQSYLPALGVRPEQIPTIERWTVLALDELNAHFSEHPYLLGSKPCAGDFGLTVPMYAHFCHDAYPRRVLMEPRPALLDWAQRMNKPPQPRAGDFLEDDHIPETLTPILQRIFADFWPYFEEVQAQLEPTLRSRAKGKVLPRIAPKQLRLSVSDGHNGSLEHLGSFYALWMAQRVQDVVRALSPQDRAEVEAWLATVGGERLMQLEIVPRLEPVGLRVRPIA